MSDLVNKLKKLAGTKEAYPGKDEDKKSDMYMKDGKYYKDGKEISKEEYDKYHAMKSEKKAEAKPSLTDELRKVAAGYGSKGKKKKKDKSKKDMSY